MSSAAGELRAEAPATPRSEARELLRLAIPAILTQVATMLMGVVDTLMVSQLGTEALAATTLGTVWVFGTLVPVLGILFGLDPIIAQAHGAGDGQRCGLALQRGLVLAGMLTLPLAALWWVTGPVLGFMGQEPALAAVAQSYVRVQLFSILPFLVFTALRQYLSGRAIMAPALWVVCLANVANVLLNWMFIYGGLGVEARGVAGAGIATGLSRVILMALLIAWVLAGRLHVPAWLPWTRQAWAWKGLREVLGYGLPTGAQVGLEVWGFHSITFLAGMLGAVALAAHAIVLQMASLTFMVPFGISIAAAARVGNLVGAGRRRAARIAAFVAIGLAVAFMAGAAITFVLLRNVLPRAYGATPEVLALAALILPVAAAFQVFDGTQAVGCGVLRGLGDTKPAALYNLIGYYALGLPLGWWLGFRMGMGLAGLWWGLVLGLASVAGLLTLRIHRKT